MADRLQNCDSAIPPGRNGLEVGVRTELVDVAHMSRLRYYLHRAYRSQLGAPQCYGKASREAHCQEMVDTSDGRLVECLLAI
jgi:hypothetical protein